MKINNKNLRILICRPDRIGDVVLSTPIPREIKRKYPHSFVAVLVREYTKDIYLNNPYVDEIIIYDEKISLFDLAKLLKQSRFTHSLILLPNEKINWAAFFSGIKTRIGVGHKFYQFLSNTKSVYRNKYIPLRHEADYSLDMIRKLQIEPLSSNPEIHLTEKEKEQRGKIRKDFSPNGEFIIGINSTSGRSAPNIKPVEYKKLIDKLRGYNVKIVITDLDPPEELIEIKDVQYPNIENNLRESIITFAALDVLISSSTGPMHIASALKIKTMSLFSPLPACSPELWGPLGNESVNILPEDNYCKVICSGDPKNCFFEGKGGIDAAKIFGIITKYFPLKNK